MSIVEQLSDAGFHLLASMPVARAIAEAPQLAAPLAGCSRVLVVANDVELWPAFVLEYQTSAKLRAAHDPFDAWVEQQIKAIAGPRPVFYAHRTYPTNVIVGSSESALAYLPMQRLAIAAQLATPCNAQLVVHPVVGPWISLRALVGLFAGDDVDLPSPIDGLRCAGACDARLAAAAAKPGATWRDWYELRLRCAVPAKRWIFSDEQILYHYTKDRSVIGTGAKLSPR